MFIHADGVTGETVFLPFVRLVRITDELCSGICMRAKSRSAPRMIAMLPLHALRRNLGEYSWANRTGQLSRGWGRLAGIGGGR